MVAVAILLMPCVANAKRGPHPKVDPVDYNGARYTAHTDDHWETVEAADIKTGKQLWVVKIYRNNILPFMEEDVQWVFIKDMFILDGKLIIISEDSRAFDLNLADQSVQKLAGVPKRPETQNPPAGNTN